MKVVILGIVQNCRNVPRLEAFHLNMFHGNLLFRADGSEYLKKNIIGHTEMSQPSLDLLVSEPVIRAIEAVAAPPRHEETAICWYAYRWDLNVPTPKQVTSVTSMDAFVEAQPEVGGGKSRKLFALHPTRIHRSPYGQQNSDSDVLTSIPYDIDYEEKYWIDPSRIEQEGVVCTSPSHIFRRDVFDRIAGFVTEPFFFVVERDL